MSGCEGRTKPHLGEIHGLHGPFSEEMHKADHQNGIAGHAWEHDVDDLFTQVTKDGGRHIQA